MQINGISVRNKKPEDLAALCQGVEGSECLVAFHRPPRRDAYEVGCSSSTELLCLPQSACDLDSCNVVQMQSL